MSLHGCLSFPQSKGHERLNLGGILFPTVNLVGSFLARCLGVLVLPKM